MSAGFLAAEVLSKDYKKQIQGSCLCCCL